MNSPQFGFGSSVGSWPSSSTTATTSNFGNLNTTNNKLASTTPFTSFGNVSAPTASPLSFGVTTTTTTKPGNLNLLILYYLLRKLTNNFILGFSLSNNVTTNAPLNLSFCAAAPTTTTLSAFSLGTTLNAKTAVPSTGTQLTLVATTNATTSTVAPSRFKLNLIIIQDNQNWMLQ